jgi:hypothetical protein
MIDFSGVMMAREGAMKTVFSTKRSQFFREVAHVDPIAREGLAMEDSVFLNWLCLAKTKPIWG